MAESPNLTRLTGKFNGPNCDDDQPLTDYQRYQFAWGIPGNIAAGENIRILDATDQDFGIPDQDWWMFDDYSVIHLNFRPDGTQINRELIAGKAAECQKLKKVAIENSVPFFDYLKERG